MWICKFSVQIISEINLSHKQADLTLLVCWVCSLLRAKKIASLSEKKLKTNWVSSINSKYILDINKSHIWSHSPSVSVTLTPWTRKMWRGTTSWRLTWLSASSASSQWLQERRWLPELNQTSCWWSSTSPDSLRPSGSRRWTTMVRLCNSCVLIHEVFQRC